MMRYYCLALFVVFLMLCTFAVLQDMHVRFGYQHWQFYIYMPAPALLTYMAMKSWHLCFVWRRMFEGRRNMVRQVRGIEGPYFKNKPSRLLERMCIALALIGLWGALHQLKVATPHYWVLGIVATWILLGLVFKSGKHQ